MYLVAAAAALIIGGPVVAVVATGGGDSGSNQAADPHPTSPAEDAFFHHMTEKVQATDPVTKVDATVGTEKKAWGTHAVLELNNVTGPEKCSLIAVSKTGEEEVVTSWSVPKWGYGIKDSRTRPRDIRSMSTAALRWTVPTSTISRCAPSTESGWWTSTHNRPTGARRTIETCHEPYRCSWQVRAGASFA